MASYLKKVACCGCVCVALAETEADQPPLRFLNRLLHICDPGSRTRARTARAQRVFSCAAISELICVIFDACCVFELALESHGLSARWLMSVWGEEDRARPGSGDRRCKTAMRSLAPVCLGRKNWLGRQDRRCQRVAPCPPQNHKKTHITMFVWHPTKQGTLV